MNEPLLTVAIPTFNGSKTILQALDSVFRQIHPEIEKKIEIIVSDNASTDGTPKLIAGLDSAKLKSVRYFSNPSNVGFDRNIGLLFERSVGRYVLPLADDDWLEDGALDEIISFLQANPQVDVYFIGGTARPVREKNHVCSDGNEFFAITEFRNGGVSSNIFRRKAWSKIEVEKYFGCEWIHFAALIDILEEGCSAISRTQYVNEISIPIEKKWGVNGRFIVVGLKLAAIFRQMNPNSYTLKVRRKALDTIHDKFYFKKIIRAKCEGFAVDISFLKTFILLFKKYPTFWLLDLPALILPANSCRLLFRIQTWLRSRRRFSIDPR